MIDPLYADTLNDRLNDFVYRLKEKDAVFKNIFAFTGDTCELNGEDEVKANRIFDELKTDETSEFTGYNLCSFIQKWRNEMYPRRNEMYPMRNEMYSNVGASQPSSSQKDEDDNDEECKALNLGSPSIFEFKNGSYRGTIPIVRPTMSKGRPNEFDPYTFILKCESKNSGIPINLQCETEDDDLFEGLEMDEDSFQETLNMKEYADNDLRYMAKIVAILNERRFGYHILELCGETHLHIK